MGTECCYGVVLGEMDNFLIDEVVETYEAFEKLVRLSFQDQRMDDVELEPLFSTYSTLPVSMSIIKG